MTQILFKGLNPPRLYERKQNSLFYDTRMGRVIPV